MSFIPNVVGVSSLQRQNKTVINLAKKTQKPVFLTQNNDITAVLLSVEAYNNLLTKIQNNENEFWEEAQNQSLDFWNHDSNADYETLA